MGTTAVTTTTVPAPDRTSHADALPPSLVDRLSALQRRAARGAAEALAADGCTLDQWRLLRALGDGEGHTMGELSEVLALPAATLTRVTDALADAALVYRRQAGEDRRRVRVHLARVGRRRLEVLEAVVAAHEQALLADPRWRADLDELHGLSRPPGSRAQGT
ncbi:DNA-binding transcriptional regulator, MarR family [Nocardioides scoriae]|uniref:DNA-binding transcriptional regulator, MarR family n=1 Tax=Nocardioides scoriae TaxID=642780 RepID=A0A1H1LG88_9ACTN|nr:DNA-binding transcriptional regulator, MarR family [Nocardioides scoriae]